MPGFSPLLASVRASRGQQIRTPPSGRRFRANATTAAATTAATAAANLQRAIITPSRTRIRPRLSSSVSAACTSVVWRPDLFATRRTRQPCHEPKPVPCRGIESSARHPQSVIQPAILDTLGIERHGLLRGQRHVGWNSALRIPVSSTSPVSASADRCRASAHFWTKPGHFETSNHSLSHE